MSIKTTYVQLNSRLTRKKCKYVNIIRRLKTLNNFLSNHVNTSLTEKVRNKKSQWKRKSWRGSKKSSRGKILTS